MKQIYLKTSRTKSGTARATIVKYFNYTKQKIRYSFRFYQDFKAFDTLKEVMDYVNATYEMAM